MAKRQVAFLAVLLGPLSRKRVAPLIRNDPVPIGIRCRELFAQHPVDEIADHIVRLLRVGFAHRIQSQRDPQVRHLRVRIQQATRRFVEVLSVQVGDEEGCETLAHRFGPLCQRRPLGRQAPPFLEGRVQRQQEAELGVEFLIRAFDSHATVRMLSTHLRSPQFRVGAGQEAQWVDVLEAVAGEVGARQGRTRLDPPRGGLDHPVDLLDVRFGVHHL